MSEFTPESPIAGDRTSGSRLPDIIAELGSASPLYRPSNFWSNLNKANIEMLDSHGLENFKRTVAQNYFNWMVISVRDNQFRKLARDWLHNPTIQPFLNSIEPLNLLRTTIGLERRIGWSQVFVYKVFVGLLWEHARKHDRTGLAAQLEEPTVGNPIVIRRNGRVISQDLANSIREFGVIREAYPALATTRTTIAELGAGYGRLAYVALSEPRCRYIIFDIPPALQVSQWYLTSIFGKDRVFGFRRFESFEDIRDELESSRIGFFTPNQIEKFPDRSFDIFATISTLSEMRSDQTRNYLEQIERTVKSIVYLKQWANWENPDDGRIFSRADIAFRALRCTLDRHDAVQDRFFEQVWQRQRA